MHHDDDHHYRRYREEHAKRLDDDYAAWRRRRDAERQGPPAQAAGEARDAGPLESLGKAIGEVVTGPASTEDAQLPTGDATDPLRH